MSLRFNPKITIFSARGHLLVGIIRLKYNTGDVIQDHKRMLDEMITSSAQLYHNFAIVVR